MLELAGKKIPETLEEIIDPGRSALLVWDMQYDISPNAFNFKEIVENLKKLTESARKAGVAVFYSNQTAFDVAKEEAAVWIRVRMKRERATDPAQLLKRAEGGRGNEIIDELKPQPQDVVFKKRRPDAFVGTDFDLMLRSKGIGTVVLSGVSTEGGIEGTARTGRNLGYYMVVLKDCVGSRNRELHDAALKVMEGAQYDVSTASEVSEVWRRKMR